MQFPGLEDAQIFAASPAEVRRRLVLGGHPVQDSLMRRSGHGENPDPAVDLLGWWWAATMGCFGPIGVVGSSHAIRNRLRGQSLESTFRSGLKMDIADLCCGIGGLSVGVHWAAFEAGIMPRTALLADTDANALALSAANLRPQAACDCPVEDLTPQHLAGAEMVVSGPPCQGFSTMNRHSRAGLADPRNSIYIQVADLAAQSGVDKIIVENVPPVRHTLELEAARHILQQGGFLIEDGVLEAHLLGWPQTRRRHFLVGRRSRPPIPLARVAAMLRSAPRPVDWALGLHHRTGVEIMDQPARLGPKMQARIDYLHAHDLYDATDLPEDLMFDCQPAHGFKYAVASRMRPDRPAPTILSRFPDLSQGRFGHPHEPRGLSLGEGAIIQGFPLYWWQRLDPSTASRHRIARWIGQAVPPVLGHAAALAVLLDDD